MVEPTLPEAIRLLKTRSLLERCERAGWIKATTRQAPLVLYMRAEVMAAVYRISPVPEHIGHFAGQLGKCLENRRTAW
jgi:hypothetical protein